jgi:hypothetical protein
MRNWPIGSTVIENHSAKMAAMLEFISVYYLMNAFTNWYDFSVAYWGRLEEDHFQSMSMNCFLLNVYGICPGLARTFQHTGLARQHRLWHDCWKRTQFNVNQRHTPSSEKCRCATGIQLYASAVVMEKKLKYYYYPGFHRNQSGVSTKHSHEFYQ